MDNTTNNNNSSTTTNYSNLSFLDEKQSVSFHIKDLVFLILHNLHWLILFAVLGALIANFLSRRQEKVYASQAKILIRSGNSISITDSDTRQISMRSTFGLRPFFANSINNEMMILTSKTTIQKAVEELKLNVIYSTETRFLKKKKNLYAISPIELEFNDEDFLLPDYLSLKIIDKQHILLRRPGHHSLLIPLDKPVMTPMGKMVAHKTWAFVDRSVGQEIIVQHRDLSAVTEYYRSRLVVKRNDERNTILNLSMKDSSPQRCADFINAVIRVYNEGAVNDKKRIINDTYNYINERISIISSDLGAQETAIAAYRSSSDLMASSSFGGGYASTSMMSDNEAIRLQNELGMARNLLETIKASDGTEVIPYGSISNGVVASYLTKYNNHAQTVARYKEMGTVNNPVAARAIENQNQQRDDLISMTEGYISSLEQRIINERSIASAASAKVRSVPMKQLYLGELERNQKIKEELYVSLLTRREELMISKPSLEGNAKIIDSAPVNKTPIAPNTSHSTFVGAIIGLLVPVAFYLLKKLFDTQVKSYSDIESAITVPFLTEIPSMPDDDDRSIVITEKEHDGIAESFRHLRAKIDFLGGAHGGARVLLFSSLIPASGKTFTTSNLAASIGLTNKKVLLMDLDLRKGSLTRKFYSRKKPGIVNYLTEKETDIDNLQAGLGTSSATASAT